MQTKMSEQEFVHRFGLTLDEQQMAAMKAAQGPVLLLAVPGSGKTTVLLARLGYLIYCCGVAPRNILTMTYTVAATQEMRTRFAAKFGDEMAQQLHFATINSVCVRVLRLFETETGRTPFELVPDDGKLSILLRDIWVKQLQDYPTESDLRATRTMITYIKNQMLRTEEIEELALDGSRTKIAPIYKEYCRVMQANRWMDYDDQMVYALQILRQYPTVLQRLRGMYTHFCVDEAQDTSKIQHCIIALLAAGTCNLFMVGDEDQSIYGFRAACPEILLHFEKDWQNAKILFLEQNYRSTPEIISRADRFIQRNIQRREKHMRTDNPSGCEVQRFVCQDREAQYLWLAKVAEEANATHIETAVLYRDNDSALPVIDLLERNGTPYRAKGVDGLFFTSRIVRDITDIVHLSEKQSDGDAFLRVYYKFKAGISRMYAETAATKATQQGVSVFTVLRKMELQSWTKTQVQKLQLNFKHLSSDSAYVALERIVEDMNYGAYLEENGMRTGALDILRALAAQARTPRQLLDRLAELQQLVRRGGSDSQSPFVLSTIHSSKGLEYEQVILADVVDGVLPQDPTLGIMPTPEELKLLEEDRRLFYVGMTRAKTKLTLAIFTRTDLHSTFAEQLFPLPAKSKSAGTSGKIRRGGNAITAGYVARTVSSAPGSKLPEGYCLNARVVHNAFGAGRIVDCTPATVTIRFADGITKNFLLDVALSAGAIRLVEE